jgi:hypothetical protein
MRFSVAGRMSGAPRATVVRKKYTAAKKPIDVGPTIN